MGTISITLPIKVSGKYRITDSEFAKKLVKDIEDCAVRESPFDEVLGIWADRKETSEELSSRLRKSNNRRDG